MQLRAAGGLDPPAAPPRLRRPWLGIAIVLLAVACGDGAEPSTTATTGISLATTTTARADLSTTTTTSAAATTQSGASFDVQGHRGARGLQPENTLPAFEAALDLGVDTLELDLHFTADGEVVVWHDPIVSPDKCRFDATRSIAGPDLEEANDADIAVAGFTRQQLRAYRCDRNPDERRFPDQRAEPTGLAGDNYEIVTLGELFDFVAAYAAAPAKSAEQRNRAAAVRFNVETKRVPDRPETINDGFDGVDPGPFELALLEVIDAYEIADRVTVQSFDLRSLRAIRSVDDEIELAALTRRNEPFPADTAQYANVWSPDYRSLSAAAIDAAHAAGMQVIPWTVNETADMARLIGFGVDGLITDRPDLLLAVLAEES